MALPTFQYILDALQARHDFLAKRRQNDFASSSTLDHDSGTAYGGEEVMDRLVVDFEVGTAQEIFPALVSLDESEDILHSTRNNTGFIFVSGEGIRLPGRSLAVCEDDRVVTLHGGVDMRLCDCAVDRLVRRTSEDRVKVELVVGWIGRARLGMNRIQMYGTSARRRDPCRVRI